MNQRIPTQPRRLAVLPVIAFIAVIIGMIAGLVVGV